MSTTLENCTSGDKLAASNGPGFFRCVFEADWLADAVGAFEWRANETFQALSSTGLVFPVHSFEGASGGAMVVDVRTNTAAATRTVGELVDALEDLDNSTDLVKLIRVTREEATGTNAAAARQREKSSAEDDNSNTGLNGAAKEISHVAKILLWVAIIAGLAFVLVYLGKLRGELAPA